MIAGVQDNSNVRGGTWEQGEWTFVALTWDGGVLSLYVNDKMVAEKKLGKPDFSKNNSGGAIWLAQWKGGPGWDFKGAIDEVGVFNVALGADDLAKIMNDGLGKATGVTAVSRADKMAITWGTIREAS